MIAGRIFSTISRSVFTGELYFDSYRAAVACLTVGFDRDGTRAGREIIGQSEDHLREVAIHYQSHTLCRDVVALLITVNQIHDDCRRRFTLCPLNIPDKDNHPRVSITPEIERVRFVHNRKWIFDEEG